MTGLEPLIGQALGKAAGVGAARAVGWSATKLIDANHDKRVLEHLRGTLPGLTDRAVAIPGRVVEFASGPEIEHFAAALTQAYVLQSRRDKDAAKLIEQIENEFYLSLQASIGEEPDTALARLLYLGLNEAVLRTIKELHLPSKSTPALEAELIKVVSSLSAASLRNTSLLKQVTSIGVINQFQEELRNQIIMLHSTMGLPHAGTTQRVPYDELFIEPLVTAKQLNDHPIVTVSEYDSNKLTTVKIADALAHATRVVLLGDPGGGKSTIANKVVHDIATGAIEHYSGKVPLFVTLRDYAPHVKGNHRKSIIEYIEDQCRTPYATSPPTDAIEYVISNGRAAVVFDGLDELLETSLRREVVRAVEGFSHKYPTCPVLVTSRRVGYDEAALDSDLFMRLDLAEFSQQQVSEYVQKWFKLEIVDPGGRSSQLASAFMSDSGLVHDLRSNPLLLSLMCGIYATEGYIPRNRPEVYEKCALLLFERWDAQRGIAAGLPFDAHVQAAMRSLALYIYTQNSGPAALPRSELVAHIRDYLHLKRFADEIEAENAANDFIDFCKGRAWVLTDVGADLYGFTHRTFLEYFAASQLVRTNTSPALLLDSLLPHLVDQSWEVVAQLALQILNKSVEDGADQFLSELLDIAESEVDCPERTMVSNLSAFTCRAMQFIVPSPQTLQRIVSLSLELCRRQASPLTRDELPPEQKHFEHLLESSSAENRPRIWSIVCKHIQEVLEADIGDEFMLAVALFLGHPRSRPATWHDWLSSNQRLVDDAVAAHPGTWWVQIYRYEVGLTELCDVVTACGPRALFEYNIWGMVAGPPIAYTALHSDPPGDFGSEIFNVAIERSSQRKLTNPDAGAVCSVLYEVAQPWVTAMSYTVGDALNGARPRRRRSNLVRLTELLALPFIEEEASFGSNPEEVARSYSPEFAQYVRHRVQLQLGLDSGRDSEDGYELAGRDAHQRFLSAWANGSFSLVKSEPRIGDRK